MQSSNETKTIQDVGNCGRFQGLLNSLAKI